MPKYYDEALLKANTDNGRDWLQKYLHPPGERGQSYNGYPDKSTTPSIHADFRITAETFQPIPSVFTGFKANTMVVLTAPGLLRPAFYLTGTATNPRITTLYQNSTITQASVYENYGRYRTAYRSVTAQLDATSVANAGMIYHAQFFPTVYHLDTPTLAAMLSTTHRSRSIKADGDDIIIIGKKPRAVDITNTTFQVVKLDALPSSPQDITMLSPKSYTARATEGLFSVYQCADDVNTFKSTGVQKYNQGVANEGNLYQCIYEFRDAGVSYLEYFSEQPTSDVPVYDAEWSDWSWSWTVYTNLTIEGGASVNFKDIIGVEVNPVIRSVLNSQTMPPAMYDPTALQTACVITQSRADGMPASFNAGGLMTAIGASIAPTLIKDVVGAVTGADSKPGEKETISKTLEKSAQLEPAKEAAAETLTQATNGGGVVDQYTRRPQPKPRRRQRPAPQRRRPDPQMVRIERMLCNLAMAPRSRPNSRPRRRSRSRSNSRTRRMIRPGNMIPRTLTFSRRT